MTRSSTTASSWPIRSSPTSTLISRAPARLNRAGVGDLLSIQTGRFDWALGAKAGTIEFDDVVDAAARRAGVGSTLVADEVAVTSDIALEHIIRAYVEVNALLLHRRP